MTVEIPLSRGLVALVDDEDAPRVLTAGSYATAEQAALVYDDAALEAWGDFAPLNFPKEIPA